MTGRSTPSAGQVGRIVHYYPTAREDSGVTIALWAWARAVAAAGRNPLALLGIADRGRIAVGQRADLVELDRELRVRRVMRAGTWFAAAG